MSNKEVIIVKKPENLKIVGFFGQSGAGKTTIIRNIPDYVDGIRIIRNTGIIRYLFNKTPNSYISPSDIMYRFSRLGDDASIEQIMSLYDKYIRSQLQLMHDFSTEVFLASRDTFTEPTIMLVDRCPMDFAILTECGVEHLQSILGGNLTRGHKKFIELCRVGALKNTKNFFDAIFITKAWSDVDSTHTLTDAIRDQYLSAHYTDDNWYGKFTGIDETKTKVITIPDDIITLNDRTVYVANKLSEV